MSDKKYYQNYDEFLVANPQISSDWREFMEPVIQGEDDEFFSFIMSYIFM